VDRVAHHKNNRWTNKHMSSACFVLFVFSVVVLEQAVGFSLLPHSRRTRTKSEYDESTRTKIHIMNLASNNKAVNNDSLATTDKNSFQAPSLSTKPTTTFDRTALEAKYSQAFTSRWTEFLRESAPLAQQTAKLWASGRLRRDDPSLATAVRQTLTKLGPVFVKLGQIVSVREDILGPVWAAELALLQNSVGVFGGREAVDEALSYDSRLQSQLVQFDSIPVAVASIAQVHRGKWRSDGENDTIIDVAIKVLRPNVARQVGIDLCVLLRAGDILSEWVPRILPVSQVDWQALLAGLAQGLWEEVDLAGEAQRQIRFGNNMDSVPRVFVPRVLAYNPDILVSEWVDGIPLRTLPSMDVRLKEAQTLMRDAYCKSMYVDAFFHADGHGGNLLWVERQENINNGEGKLCILDCGLMVDIGQSSAEGLLRLSLHLGTRDWTRVVDDIIALGFLPENLSPNLKAEARGIARRIIGPYLDVGGGAKAASVYSISSLFDDVSTATLKLPTSLPPDMILLARAVIQLEGLALRAYPNYRLVDDILPVAARIALRSAPGFLSSNMNDRSGTDDARTSLLLDLLYEDSRDIFYEGTTYENVFSPERFLQLLDTARGDRSSTGMSIEEFVEEVLQADAARDLVAQETFRVLDVLVRDTVWKGVDTLEERGLRILPSLPFFPKDWLSPRTVLETLSPRISEKEQLTLLRLLDSLNEIDGSSDAKLSSSLFSSLPVINESPLVKIATIPGVSKSLRDVSVAAIFRSDANARAAIDAVSEEMIDHLSARLVQAGAKVDLAYTISSTLLQRPWSANTKE